MAQFSRIASVVSLSHCSHSARPDMCYERLPSGLFYISRTFAVCRPKTPTRRSQSVHIVDHMLPLQPAGVANRSSDFSPVASHETAKQSSADSPKSLRGVISARRPPTRANSGRRSPIAPLDCQGALCFATEDKLRFALDVGAAWYVQGLVSSFFLPPPFPLRLRVLDRIGSNFVRFRTIPMFGRLRPFGPLRSILAWVWPALAGIGRCLHPLWSQFGQLCSVSAKLGPILDRLWSTLADFGRSSAHSGHVCAEFRRFRPNSGRARPILTYSDLVSFDNVSQIWTKHWPTFGCISVNSSDGSLGQIWLGFGQTLAISVELVQVGPSFDATGEFNQHTFQVVRCPRCKHGFVATLGANIDFKLVDSGLGMRPIRLDSGPTRPRSPRIGAQVACLGRFRSTWGPMVARFGPDRAKSRRLVYRSWPEL